MILIATLVLVSVSMASTTLPKVPCPSSFTVRSVANDQGTTSTIGKRLTAPVDQVIWDNDIVSFLVVARDCALGGLGVKKTPLTRHVKKGFDWNNLHLQTWQRSYCPMPWTERRVQHGGCSKEASFQVAHGPPHGPVSVSWLGVRVW